jgi:hypothetical protein
MVGLRFFRRTPAMRRLAALTLALLTLTLALALPATAETVVSEARGNWAGASNEGFHFLAELYQDRDRLGLRIWNGADPLTAPDGGPALDNPWIELAAFATRPALESYETPAGSILQVVVEFADEEAEGRSVTQIRYLDNQFTVVGYYHLSRFYNPGGEPVLYECDLDLWTMKVIENGQERQLPPVTFEVLNASAWNWGAAFDRGYCRRTE